MAAILFQGCLNLQLFVGFVLFLFIFFVGLFLAPTTESWRRDCIVSFQGKWLPSLACLTV